MPFSTNANPSGNNGRQRDHRTHPLITTNPRCHIEGAEHVDFHEHDPRDCTDAMIVKSINRFKNRTAKIEIPKNVGVGVHGFSHEYINYMLGGSFRASYTPLNALKPPSTGTTTPVTNSDAGDSSQMAVPANSSGSPKRRVGA